MTQGNKKTRANKAAASRKAPRKLVPRPAEKMPADPAEVSPEMPLVVAEPVTEAVAEAPAPATPEVVQEKTAEVTAPAAAVAKTKVPRPRRPSREDETVARHHQSLVEALAMAEAIKYDAPLVVKKAPPKGRKATKEAKPVKPPKARKIKLVRNNYAMPETEYAQIGALKKRLAEMDVDVKKSELLRAGIALLVALDDAGLKTALAAVERLKTGRPAK